jgi:hypothetical protein
MKEKENEVNLLVSFPFVLDCLRFNTMEDGGGPNECTPKLMRVIKAEEALTRLFVARSALASAPSLTSGSLKSAIKQ